MTEQTTKQAETLKRIAGVDEFYPSMWEVSHAGELFRAEIEKLKQIIIEGEMSIDTAINIAVVKVWSQARRYQSEKQAKQENETKELKRLFDVFVR